MMTFTEFSQRLARGQLKNTSAVSDSELGVLDPTYVNTILGLTNQGLIDLTTRLPLITRQIDLVFQTDMWLYPMDIAGVGTYFDESETDVFAADQFVKILDIYDEDGDRHSPDTKGHIITPTYNTLRFTSAIIEELEPKVRIRYQALHPAIDSTSNIDLPPNIETALQLFVASLYISHMNGSDHSAKGDSYFAAYLRHLGEDEARNTSSTSEIDEDTRLEDRGFV